MRNYLDEETLDDEYKKAMSTYFGKKGDRKRYVFHVFRFIASRTLLSYQPYASDQTLLAPIALRSAMAAARGLRQPHHKVQVCLSVK